MSEQLELPLDDDKLKYSAIVEKMIAEYKNYSDTNVYIFTKRSHITNKLVSYIGTRTHCYDTDYTYDHKITVEMAVYLLDKFPDLYDFCDNTKKAVAASAKS